jgi:hypothetical protein
MPTQQTFYLNGPNLATATVVFLDSGMTLCAPDGSALRGTGFKHASLPMAVPQ